MPRPKIIVRYDCCKTSLTVRDFGYQCMQCGTVYDYQRSNADIGWPHSEDLTPVHRPNKIASTNLKREFSK